MNKLKQFTRKLTGATLLADGLFWEFRCFSPGGFPYKIDVGAHQKFSKNSLKDTRILFVWHGLKILLPLEVAVFNSTCHILSYFFGSIPYRYHDNSNRGHFRFQQTKLYQSTNFDPKKVRRATPPHHFHIGVSPPPRVLFLLSCNDIILLFLLF